MKAQMTNILDQIQNKIGAFWGVGMAPAAGTTKATITGTMPANEITDPSNWVRLEIYADFGAGPKFMAKSADWKGGPGQTAPSLTWQFNLSNPPLLVYGILENGIRGAGSPAICGLGISFS